MPNHDVLEKPSRPDVIVIDEETHMLGKQITDVSGKSVLSVEHSICIRLLSDISMVMDFLVHPNFDDTVPSTKEIEDEDKIVKPVF